MDAIGADKEYYSFQTQPRNKHYVLWPATEAFVAIPLIASGDADEAAFARKAALDAVTARLGVLLTESEVTQRNHVERVALGLE